MRQQMGVSLRDWVRKFRPAQGLSPDAEMALDLLAGWASEDAAIVGCSVRRLQMALRWEADRALDALAELETAGLLERVEMLRLALPGKAT